MNLWILDTDHFSLFQRGHPIVVQRVINTNSQQLAITIISVEEQIRGRLNIIRRSTSRETVLAYANLKSLLDDIQHINILDFTNDADDCYQDLVKQKIRVGTRDLRIAAIALSVDGIVVTRNKRDFEKVPNLRFEDWTV
ncbi:MAG: type II toxin-antitoxin system VapC family toxin [Xenococcaceae cyanobacterium]